MDKHLLRLLLPRVLKAAAKSAIVIILFLVISQFLTPLSNFFPQVYGLVETYVAVYVAFIIVGELTKGSIYQHVLGMGKAFFFIGYAIYALNNGMITQTIQSITFSANLEIFITIIIFLGTLDFAESLLQVINYLANKAETETISIPKLEQEIPTS